MVKFNKIKFTKHLNIITFILWLSLLIKVIFAPSGTDLRFACIASMAVICIDLFLDIIENTDKRFKRKITLEYIVHESDNNKQGEE